MVQRSEGRSVVWWHECCWKALVLWEPQGSILENPKSLPGRGSLRGETKE